MRSLTSTSIIQTEKINMSELKPHEVVRIEFLQEIESRNSLSLLFLIFSPIFGLMTGIASESFVEGFVEGFLVVFLMGNIMFVIPMTIFGIQTRNNIYSRFFSSLIEKNRNYKYCYFNPKDSNLYFFNNKKIEVDDTNEKGFGFDQLLKFLSVKTLSLNFFETKNLQKDKVIDKIFFSLDQGITTIYFTILWPFFFNPVQLAFLEYDKVKKYRKLNSGEKVLILGGGAVPHHIRYKKFLGGKGKIVVSDNHIPSLFVSKWIERVYECIPKLFGIKRRTPVEYTVCDSTDTFPFKNNTFDIIVAVRNYCIDYDECQRVVKENGVIYATNLAGWLHNQPPKEKILHDDFVTLVKV